MDETKTSDVPLDPTPALSLPDQAKHLITCRYFKLGLCRYGDNCQYYHDSSELAIEPVVSPMSQKICKFYNLGGCVYGLNCTFSHSSPDKNKIVDRLRTSSKNSESDSESGDKSVKISPLASTPKKNLDDHPTTATACTSTNEIKTDQNRYNSSCDCITNPSLQPKPQQLKRLLNGTFESASILEFFPCSVDHDILWPDGYFRKSPGSPFYRTDSVDEHLLANNSQENTGSTNTCTDNSNKSLDEYILKLYRKSQNNQLKTDDASPSKLRATAPEFLPRCVTAVLDGDASNVSGISDTSNLSTSLASDSFAYLPSGAYSSYLDTFAPPSALPLKALSDPFANNNVGLGEFEHVGDGNKSDIPLPTLMSYKDVAATGLDQVPLGAEGGGDVDFEQYPFCIQYLETGVCNLDVTCPYIHGTQCNFCSRFILDPRNSEQQLYHQTLCEEELMENMKYSFAVQRSEGLTCGICLDIVMEKSPIQERRFGILSNCNHIFCLQCIRTWRTKKETSQVDLKATRSCPSCRTHSDFITPSAYWVSDPEEKVELISNYKKHLNQTHCKYYKRGSTTCPFYDKCFYKHEHPDGRPATPKTRPKRTKRYGNNGVETLDEDEMLMIAHFLQTRIRNSSESSDDDDDDFRWLNWMTDEFDSDDDIYVF